MIVRIFLLLTAFLLASGAAVAGEGLVLPDPPPGVSATCPECPQVEYYRTKDGVTERYYPKTDVPFVADMRSRPPLTTQMSVFWVDFDSNTILIAYIDLDIGPACDGAFGFIFSDVNLALGADWEDNPPLTGFPMACEALEGAISDAMGPKSASE